MTVYYVNLLLILALAFPLCLYKPSKPKKLIYLLITFGYMWFLAAFRQGIGFDYQSYIDIFNQVKEAQDLAALWALQQEFLFVLLTKGMTLFISSPTVMYGVYAALVLLPAVWFIYKYCRDAWLSTWLYVTLTFFYTSMNFVRQSLAAAIILLGFDFLRKKKTLPFLLVVVAAGLFHKTAFIMIPVYFVCHWKLTKKLAVFYGVATLALFLTSSAILNLVTNYIFTSYKNSIYVTGFGMEFLLIPFFVFGGCLALKTVWEKRESDAALLLNLMMYNAIIWLFITRHFILERLSMYMYIFVILAVPSAIACLRRPQEEYAARNALAAELKADKKAGGKEQHAKLAKMTQTIKDHEKYYWSAVTATLILTAIYNDFGANVNGFHHVFPYHSVLEWLNRIMLPSFL